VEDHDNLFVMAELVHFVGIGLLAWKLLKKKNAGGELWADFFAEPCVRSALPGGVLPILVDLPW
jgi:hypothetical protein